MATAKTSKKNKRKKGSKVKRSGLALKQRTKTNQSATRKRTGRKKKTQRASSSASRTAKKTSRRSKNTRKTSRTTRARKSVRARSSQTESSPAAATGEGLSETVGT